MNIRAPFSSTYTLANHSVLEEVLYDLPTLEGIFLHWHTTGGTALTSGITSLFSQQEHLLGSATLPGANMQVLAACASECLHRLLTNELSAALVLLPWPKRWDTQAREVAISLSLWESLLLPLSCLRPLLRLSAARAYPGVRVIDLHAPQQNDAPLAQVGAPACLRAGVHPGEVQS